MTKLANPFRYFNSSPEVIRLAVMMYVKHPLSLRNVEDLLAERGIQSGSDDQDTPVTCRRLQRAVEMGDQINGRHQGQQQAAASTGRTQDRTPTNRKPYALANRAPSTQDELALTGSTEGVNNITSLR
jgi:hypothetical protein